MPNVCKYCITGFLLLLLYSSHAQTQFSDSSSQNYILFQKEFEYRIRLLQSQTEKPVKYETVFVELPNGLFNNKLTHSLFVAFGVSDPVDDTSQAYKMALSRAIFMANISTGMDIDIFYEYFVNEKSSGKTELDSRFIQFYDIKSKKRYMLADSIHKPFHFRLPSGETIVFLQKYDLMEMLGSECTKDFLFSIWLSEHQSFNKYEPIKRISIKPRCINKDVSSFNSYSSGKLKLSYTLSDSDSIVDDSKYYVYQNSIEHFNADSSYSIYPLKNGIWTALINNLVNEIIDKTNIKNGNVSGMEEEYNNQLRTYSQDIGTNVSLKLKILDVQLFENDLYLKTIYN